ncbi:helix-turn-helix domain-containing protein [Bifidobacterium sp. ESL0728]|uniref:helix-turn-helix domain-containing protein n=1 Tax=Bifidobacterium sp. ESL0728 TaxID=2983220 RepID=UPI0023F61E60|nr:helix-turn-helix domain-containing protein [Bifidobacterium sp. ESL0728]WEV59158.1 helix-turn-helix domain-containing protein [Bifidobacterium sp. ESL0728]
MQLGGQIRDHREAMGLSQDDLAGKIFVSRQTVSNWETGRTYPDVQNLLLLGNLFGITLDELVKGDVETMNEEIKRNGRQLVMLNTAGWIALIVGLVMLGVAFAVCPRLEWWWLMGTGILLLALSCGLGGASYRLSRDIDIVTYKELKAYLAGEDIDRSSRKPWQRWENQWKVFAVVVVVAAVIGGILGLMAYHYRWL